MSICVQRGFGERHVIMELDCQQRMIGWIITLVQSGGNWIYLWNCSINRHMRRLWQELCSMCDVSCTTRDQVGRSSSGLCWSLLGAKIGDGECHWWQLLRSGKVRKVLSDILNLREPTYRGWSGWTNPHFEWMRNWQLAGQRATVIKMERSVKNYRTHCRLSKTHWPSMRALSLGFLLSSHYC